MLRGAPLSQTYLAGSLREPLVDFNGEFHILDLNISKDPTKDIEKAV